MFTILPLSVSLSASSTWLGSLSRTACCVRCIMTSLGNKRDHLQKTSDNSRNKVLAEATVTDMKDLSPTVKRISLHVPNKELSFLPGQWVDCYFPGVDKVGGFSMCSSPRKLQSEALLDLSVKHSKHAPALWVHTKCQVGSKVKIRVGGDFYYAPLAATDPHNLLLVAGGVGINPLLAIMLHVADLQLTPGTFRPGAVTLLYSASSLKELIFQDTISELCKKHCNMQAKFFVTRETRGLGGDLTIKGNRISPDELAEVFRDHETVSDVTRTLCHVCGPGPMIDDVEGHLLSMGIPKSDILYEKWW